MQSSLRTQTVEKNHVARLQKQLRNAQVGMGGEIYLSFAMFKELHDLQRYDEAWTALTYGCRAKRARLNYSMAASASLFDALQNSRLQPNASTLPQASLRDKQAFLLELIGGTDLTIDNLIRQMGLDQAGPLPDDVTLLLITRTE